MPGVGKSAMLKRLKALGLHSYVEPIDSLWRIGVSLIAATESSSVSQTLTSRINARCAAQLYSALAKIPVTRKPSMAIFERDPFTSCYTFVDSKAVLLSLGELTSGTLNNALYVYFRGEDPEHSKEMIDRRDLTYDRNVYSIENVEKIVAKHEELFNPDSPTFRGWIPPENIFIIQIRRGDNTCTVYKKLLKHLTTIPDRCASSTDLPIIPPEN